MTLTVWLAMTRLPCIFGELLRCKRCKLSSSIFIQKILTKLHLNILTRSDRENTTCFHQLVQFCLTRRNFSIIKSWTLIVVVHEGIFLILCMHFQLSTRPPIINYHHQLYQESKMIGQNPEFDSFTFSSLRTRLKIKIPSEMEVAPRYHCFTLFKLFYTARTVHFVFTSSTAYIVYFAYIAHTV